MGLLGKLGWPGALTFVLSVLLGGAVAYGVAKLIGFVDPHDRRSDSHHGMRSWPIAGTLGCMTIG